MAIAQLQHDGFARVTLYRERIADTRRECRECGQSARFRYAWAADDRTFGRPSFMTPPSNHPFCSVGCARAYGAI